jgi:hypothetical protein
MSGAEPVALRRIIKLTRTFSVLIRSNVAQVKDEIHSIILVTFIIASYYIGIKKENELIEPG